MANSTPHPRTRKKLEQFRSAGADLQSVPSINSLVQWMKPLGFSDYNALQLNAYAVLSDSGTISEESSIMNFRALNIREAHERPEAMEEAAVMMVGLNPERIMQGLMQLQYQKIHQHKSFTIDTNRSNNKTTEEPA